MSFWGVEIKPGKPIAHSADNKRGRLHISQATLGIGSSTKTSLVQCNVGDKSPVLLCALLPDKTESCPLNLEFDEAEEVIFSVIGPRSVYLTGYFVGSAGRFNQNDDNTESYGEDIVNTETEESTYGSNQEKYESDFIDDDEPKVFPSSPLDSDDDTVRKVRGGRKRLKQKYQLSDSDDDGSDNERQCLVSNELELECEDEDSFPISSLVKNKNNEKNIKSEMDQKVNMEKIESAVKAAGDNGNCVVGTKRRVDSVVQSCDQERRDDLPKKKKKGVAKEGKILKAYSINPTTVLKEAKPPEDGKNMGDNQHELPMKNDEDPNRANHKNVDIIANQLIEENQLEEMKSLKKRQKKNKTKEKGVNMNAQLPVSSVEELDRSIMESDDKDAEAEASRVRNLSNGLVIQELEVGKPNGKIASTGKKVTIHYTGKLKKNGEIFCSTLGRSPYKFRLGSRKVIEGWNVGFDGMTVGERRRLVVPPAMGYGSEGAEDKVPPNAWLEFDVQLVDAR